MFIKAALAKDVRAGNVIRVNRLCPAGKQLQFQVFSAFADEEVAWLYSEKHSGIECRPDEIVGLVYQAYPEGKTEDVMRETVVMMAQRLAELNSYEDIERYIIDLSEAIEAYKLGKK